MKLPKESKLREDFASRKVFKKNLCFNLCLKQGRGYKAQSSVSLRKALAIRLNRTFFCRILLKKISPLNWTWGSLPTKVSSNSPVQLNGLSPLSKSIGWSWWTIFVPFPFQIAWGFRGETQCLTLESVANVINCTPTWNFCWTNSGRQRNDVSMNLLGGFNQPIWKIFVKSDIFPKE